MEPLNFTEFRTILNRIDKHHKISGREIERVTRVINMYDCSVSGVRFFSPSIDEGEITFTCKDNIKVGSLFDEISKWLDS